MQTIHVNASEKYDVVIGRGLLDECGERIKAVTKASKIALISDDTVSRLYGDRAAASLEKAGFTVERFTFLHGEASKCLNVLGEMFDFLADVHMTRTDAVVALGGGVTGDMAGLASAVFLRGMDFVQIPTTLLAQVDSSVGGKTAIDIKAGKNLVGAFKQPKLVICDIDVLSTLPEDTFIDGMGEVIKYGMIKSADLFRKLSAHDLSNISGILEDVIAECVSIKRDVVENDEFDTGERMLLNFGHTLAHSIEQYYDYKGISHGKAVAVGMKMITDIAEKNGMCRAGLTAELRECLKKYKLDIEVGPKPAELGEASLNDKKRAGSNIRIIVCSDVGVSEIKKISVSEFTELLKG